MRTRDLDRLHENCYFSHETGPVVFSHQGKINDLTEGMGKMKSDISGEIQGVHARMGKMESDISGEIEGVHARMCKMKSDISGEIEGVHTRMGKMKSDISGEIEGVHARMGKMKSDISGEIEGVHARMGKMKSDISGEIEGVHARMGKMESGIEELKQMIMSLHNIKSPESNQGQMFTQGDASHCNSEMELAKKQSSSTPHLTTDAPTDLDAAQKLTPSAKQPQETQQPTPQSSTPHLTTDVITDLDANKLPNPSAKQRQATKQATPEGSAMVDTKLYLCFEATNTKEEFVYLIFSAKVSDLTGNAQTSTPHFTFENSITGVSSMGCGLFDSKIVLAGGVSGKENNMEYKYGPVTYDTVTKKVSTEDIPSMRGHKLRPLVFELYGRLYVLDTTDSIYNRSCEVFYPSHKVWDEVFDPFRNIHNAFLGSKSIAGRTPFSWFVSGNTVSISSPEDSYTYIHHARQWNKCFRSDKTQPLPFHGMATTYWQRGFFDVVVISFSKGKVGGEGCVEGRLLRYFPIGFSEPQLLFRTDIYEKPDGEVSSYFAEGENGKFCLTTFDNVNIHVYVFKIFRRKGVDGGLSLVIFDLKKYKYNYNDFSHEGITSITSISGCFVLPRNFESKRSKESKLHTKFFTGYESGVKDDDLPPMVQTAEGGFEIECDSGGADSDFRDY
ncbi:hypothetical protein POM88_051435 [Heracleum sosnowskyi]|uniref:Uncharacterized protein n=1 Tax=Heracleum sosnowskyi TaxID=360622 RepID=A0AAD8H0F6_9APIA|nr:hypothetical protein POM88_051435 [Heracleum sosnowskyi]